MEVTKDLKDSYNKYNLPLKYIISSQKHMPDVLKNKERGNDTIENVFGMKVDLVDDILTPIVT